MKRCRKCNIEKKIDLFGNDKKAKDGLKSACKSCTKQYQREYDAIYAVKNKEAIIEKNRKFYIKNIEIIKVKQKEYAFNNKEKIKEYLKTNRVSINKWHAQYTKNKRKNNPLFKLSCNIRNLIAISLKNNGYTKKSKTNKYLGCTYEVFKEYLENKFTQGMTWENQGKWHLDHIYPVSLAKDEQEIIKLNHYTNFQPLWAIDNIRKSNKI